MSDTAQKNILIVDDDAVVLRTMKENLSEHYKVYGANSGANAMRILEKVALDLVLLDYEMPEMNGPEVLSAIRAHKKGASVPVLFLSGREDIDLSGLDAGGCLKKSLPQEEILSHIASVFAG